MGFVEADKAMSQLRFPILGGPVSLKGMYTIIFKRSLERGIMPSLEPLPVNSRKIKMKNLY